MLSENGIRKIFEQVPATYDLANIILTLGLDYFWRKNASRVAARQGGTAWLDVCTGTAKTAINLGRLAAKETRIVALDFSHPMLSVGASKAHSRNIHFCIGDAGTLPFPDDTFDLITISFATRNINNGKDALLNYFQEFRRVLKPEGRFVNLETSQPKNFILKKFFHFYIRCVVMPVGALISGSKEAYGYLAYTIPRFFCAEELSEIIYRSGFKRVSSSRLTFGLSAIHVANK